jgi:hypothetical protein
MIQSIKAKVSLKDTFDALGVSFVGKKAICPLHNDTKPSLHFDKRGLWYCFVCGVGGDMFNLVMRVKGTQFKETLGWFNEHFNLGLTQTKYTPDPYLEALNENYDALKKSFKKEFDDNCDRMHVMLSVLTGGQTSCVWGAKDYTFYHNYETIMDNIEEKLRVLEDAKHRRRSRKTA